MMQSDSYMEQEAGRLVDCVNRILPSRTVTLEDVDTSGSRPWVLLEGGFRLMRVMRNMHDDELAIGPPLQDGLTGAVPANSEDEIRRFVQAPEDEYRRLMT